MQPQYLGFSRRSFIKSIGVASAVMIISPSPLMSQVIDKELSLAVLGENAITISKHDQTTGVFITNDYAQADVIYINQFSENHQSSILHWAASGKHFIVEDTQVNNFIIDACDKAGVLLAIVFPNKALKSDSKLFNTVHYYENNLCESIDIQKVMLFLYFLQVHVQPHNFYVFLEKQKNTYFS